MTTVTTATVYEVLPPTTVYPTGEQVWRFDITETFSTWPRVVHHRIECLSDPGVMVGDTVELGVKLGPGSVSWPAWVAVIRNGARTTTYERGAA